MPIRCGKRDSKPAFCAKTLTIAKQGLCMKSKDKKYYKHKSGRAIAPWTLLDDWFETHPTVMGVPARAMEFLGMLYIGDWISLHMHIEDWENEEMLDLISKKTETDKQFWINAVDLYKSRKNRNKNKIK